jgi:NAD+ synthase
MTATFRLTLAQLNPTVGALSSNAAKARDAWQHGKAANADMVALPEMFLSGYQTQDLVLKPAFVADVKRHLDQLAADCADGPALGIGGPWMDGDMLRNAYFVLQGGKITAQVFKHDLPNGSPYYRKKWDRRLSHMVARVVETELPLVYLNMVGGQDDQVFDGGSFILNPGGQLAMKMPVFDEAIETVTFTETPDGWRADDGPKAILPPVEEQDYRVMVQALRDYMGKTGFTKVLLGLSGGVDSAIVATIAADALGPENVRCVMLPSEYTSPESLEDAAEVALALGCQLDTVPISGPRAAVTEALAPLFDGLDADVTEENIQSRLRGLLLMALSNKFGEMLLTTGNKSEVAVGYATIYGDMSGGFNPIKDLYKTRVFDTCRWRNSNHRDWMMGPEGTVIPPRVIDKPPSAELRDDQKDEDSLPPYEDLDQILEMLIENEASVADIVAAGFDRDVVKKVEHLLYISEYKRFQSAPGARLTSKAFWLDRRYPIVNQWRDDSADRNDG